MAPKRIPFHSKRFAEYRQGTLLPFAYSRGARLVRQSERGAWVSSASFIDPRSYRLPARQPSRP